MVEVDETFPAALKTTLYKPDLHGGSNAHGIETSGLKQKRPLHIQ